MEKLLNSKQKKPFVRPTVSLRSFESIESMLTASSEVNTMSLNTWANDFAYSITSGSATGSISRGDW